MGLKTIQVVQQPDLEPKFLCCRAASLFFRRHTQPLQSSISLASNSLQLLQHPLQTGQIFYSPGGHFSYRAIGPCCRLFDREELPWPCCRLQWRGKEPSWRRIGRRFISDIAARKHPSYCVEILGQESLRQPLVLTLYTVTLPRSVQEWWYSKRPALSQANPKIEY